ncbi:hypothetical protein AAF712_016691 [Marasmius tenuissimus]|uniref:Uncharacterized protein n=1 Tax=Marasmius tenuissimus TaxID=585030 RepID=A0ABR2Z7D5_9AGAR
MSIPPATPQRPIVPNLLADLQRQSDGPSKGANVFSPFNVNSPQVYSTAGPTFQFGTLPPPSPMGSGMHYNAIAGMNDQEQQAYWNQQLAQAQAAMSFFQQQRTQTVNTTLQNKDQLNAIATPEVRLTTGISDTTTLLSSQAAATINLGQQPGPTDLGTGMEPEGEAPEDGEAEGNIADGVGGSGSEVNDDGEEPPEDLDDPTVILKPKGTAGDKQKGFNAVCQAARRVGLKYDETYRNLDPELVSNVCKLVGKDWPYVNKK